MRISTKMICAAAFMTVSGIAATAQTMLWTKSVEGATWSQKSVRMTSPKDEKADITADITDQGLTFKAWGTCFNELGWDALNALSEQQKEKITFDLFNPKGDMKFSIGRIPMNANDYARSWYSCDTVDGDFGLHFFNIDRDMTTIIPYIHLAQKQNPDMTFWISPWSPPTWMKTNHHYAQQGTPTNGLRKEVESPTFMVNQFIMEPRYLNAYANYFCRFIEAYKAQNIPINIVMYQNEAYAFTVYPGCTWTAQGTLLFNRDYLAPALKRLHPDVDLYLGTLNTARTDIVDSILGDKEFRKVVRGAAFQWEGGKIVGKMRQKYPELKYMMSESECGWGKFCWADAEHTFSLMCHYLANGCESYNFWNAIIADDGSSTWGWKQNGLIRVDTHQKSFVYTPEYFSAKHFCHFVTAGTRLIASKDVDGKLPIMVFVTPLGKRIVIAGNFNDTPQPVTIRIGKKCLRATLDSHSFNTFSEK
jgi:glucosylceramidase